jgi:hypothetical protein
MSQAPRKEHNEVNYGDMRFSTLEDATTFLCWLKAGGCKQDGGSQCTGNRYPSRSNGAPSRPGFWSFSCPHQFPLIRTAIACRQQRLTAVDVPLMFQPHVAHDFDFAPLSSWFIALLHLCHRSLHTTEPLDMFHTVCCTHLGPAFAVSAQGFSSAPLGTPPSLAL